MYAQVAKSGSAGGGALTFPSCWWMSPPWWVPAPLQELGWGGCMWGAQGGVTAVPCALLEKYIGHHHPRSPTGLINLVWSRFGGKTRRDWGGGGVFQLHMD